MALDKLTKVQSVGISSFIQVVGVVTATGGFVGDGSGLTGITASSATGDFSIVDKIVHTGDTNTAIRFPAADTVTVETAGSEALRVISTGNIGIGTDNPGAKTHIDSVTSNTPLVVEASQNNRSRIVFRNNVETGTECNIELFDDDLRFVTNSGERLRITSAGLVGVNCTPLSQFQVKSGTNQNIALSSMSSEAAIEAFNDAGSANVPLRLRGSDLKLFTGSTERLRITSGGLIGVNVTPTQQKLTIDVDSSGTTAASFDGINICNTDSTTNNGAAIIFGQAIAGNSFSRIGVINSDRTGNSEDQDIFFGTLGGGSYGERLRITSTGDIGIANASPTNWGGGVPTIEIKGTVSSGGNSTRSGAIAFESGSGSNGYSVLWGQNGGIHIYTGATDRASATYAAQFNSSGNLAFASGNGIDFSANSNASGMTSEVLDDYEEGAFDPRLRFGTSTEIGTFNTQSKAEYVKIGKIVHVSGWARYDSVNTSNSGILHMDLPFTVDEYGMPHNYVYPGSVVLTHTDLQQKGIHIWCGNAGAARTRFGFYNSTSGSTDYVENGDLGGWNGNTRNVHFNFSYQTND